MAKRSSKKNGQLRRTSGMKTGVQRIDHPCSDLAGLWGVRILLELGVWRKLVVKNPFSFIGDEILTTVGLEELDEKISNQELLALLNEALDYFENQTIIISQVVQKNLKNLELALGLSKKDVQILLFSVVLESHPGLNAISDELGSITTPSLIRSVSVILGFSLDDVKKALSPSGPLISSGILKLSQGTNDNMDRRLELLDGFSESLFSSHKNTLDMLKEYFYQTGNRELEVSDFNHIDDDYTFIKGYLQNAIKADLHGVNILIYGVPGTGKTELAKVLANDLSSELYEVSVSDDYNEPIQAKRRFTSYQLSQKILSHNKKALIMFDEIEDVFPEQDFSFFGRSSSNSYSKAWTNHLLENNPVPAIWISNSIDQIDNAFIRRFDYVINLEIPPREIRKNILSKYLNKLSVSSEWIEEVAEHEALAPALVERASKVVSMIAHTKSTDNQRDLERVINNTLDAMGHSDKIVSKKENHSLDYRLDILNSDQNIERLVAGLKNHGEGRLCLYGPPGTGKTAFGHFVADELEKPLIVKRASDLLDMYVGQSEKNIAKMFQQATKEEAVLLLDEADSFLRDRTLASKSWEVTQVNELLTQMESFDGVFICSTNLMDKLDDASLRRFDFKIKLDYLLPEQSWVLFRQIVKQPLKSLKGIKSKLSQLRNLTPGDYANVVRQCRFMDEGLNAEILLDKLSSESVFKKGQRHKEIGFMAKI